MKRIKKRRMNHKKSQSDSSFTFRELIILKHKKQIYRRELHSVGNPLE